MGDINCRVCLEPWDAYGVRKDGSGDMLGWEAELFLKGAGCPSCQGVTPEGMDEEEADINGLGSLVTNGYDDFEQLDPLITCDLDYGKPRPRWERPEGELVWECASCGMQVRRDPDRPAETEVIGATSSNQEDEHATYMQFFGYGRQDELHEGVEPWELPDGRKLCCECGTKCDGDGHDGNGCDAILVLRDDGGNFDEGCNAFPEPGVYINPDYYCEDCYGVKSAEEQLRVLEDACGNLCRDDVKRPDDWVSLLLPDLSDLMYQDSDGSWCPPDDDAIREALQGWGWLEQPDDIGDEAREFLQGLLEEPELRVAMVAMRSRSWLRFEEVAERLEELGLPLPAEM